MHFNNRIGQMWRDKGQRIASVSLTIVMLSAVAVAVVACFGSEVLAAWKTPGNAEQALTSGGTFAELLNFEAPAQTVARLNTQKQEAERAKALAHLVVDLKNWRDTSLLDSLKDAFNAAIQQYLRPPYVTFRPDPFVPFPPAFVPDEFTGDIHNRFSVGYYNFTQEVLLALDKANDYQQRGLYGTSEIASLAVVLGVNRALLPLYIAAIDALAVKAAAAAAASSFFSFGIGSFVAAGILLAASAADVYLVASYVALVNKNDLAFAQSQALANAILKQHLALDVFTPLVAATPYQ